MFGKKKKTKDILKRIRDLEKSMEIDYYANKNDYDCGYINALIYVLSQFNETQPNYLLNEKKEENKAGRTISGIIRRNKKE